MTVYDLWKVSPRSHVFIKCGGSVVEYVGVGRFSHMIVGEVFSTSYPMYKSVLEVRLLCIE